MKTTFKTISHETAVAHKLVYEHRTGVKWEFYHVGDGYRFSPIVTRETPEDPRAAVDLEPFVDYTIRGFVALSEASGLDLPTVLSGAKYLVRFGGFLPATNRCGHFSGIYKPRRPVQS